MTQHFGPAVGEYRKVLLAEPNNISGLNNLAYLLAVCPDNNIRDGGEAIKLSERACKLTGFKEAPLINTLAAALAEQGRFSEAATVSEMASRLQVAAAEPNPAPEKPVRD